MRKKVVVIGGGTGTSVVLSALKQFPKQLALTAIVVVSDSGGSTGRLRDEFGFLPVGDARQCLAALAEGRYQKQVRKLLLYRFAKGNGLKGHNLGNLILTALEDLQSSPGKAIELAAKIFRIRGRVLPITENNVQLKIIYQDGSEIIGEHNLDDPQLGGKKIKEIQLRPSSKIYPPAKKAIEKADMIIIGPGDLYASLLPNTLVSGFKPALKKSSAKLVYISNLMTHFSQTHQMTLKDHVAEVSAYLGQKPDLILVNTAKISKQVLAHYQQYQEYPVIDDLSDSDSIIRKDFLSEKLINQGKNDTVPRSLLRHDEQKLAQTIKELL